MGFILLLLIVGFIIWFIVFSFEEKIESNELHETKRRELSAQIQTEWARGSETLSFLSLLCHSTSRGYFIRHELFCRFKDGVLRLQSTESFKGGKTVTATTHISEYQIQMVVQAHSRQELYIEPSGQSHSDFQIIAS
jgi:hypothetical protein